MKTSVSVEVLGRSYTLRVEEESVEHTRRVAQQVDQRMRSFQRRHPEQAKLTTAIITALALAEDLHQEQAAGEERADTLDGDLRALTQTLTGALGEGDGANGAAPHAGEDPSEGAEP